MVDFNRPQDTDRKVGGGQSMSELMQVFIDNGHDTIKCARVDASADMSTDLAHFEVPMALVKDLVDSYQDENPNNQSMPNQKFHSDTLRKKEDEIVKQRLTNIYNSERVSLIE